MPWQGSHPRELDPLERQRRDQQYALYRDLLAGRIGQLLAGRQARRGRREAQRLSDRERQDLLDAEMRAFGEKQLLAGQQFGYERALQADRYGFLGQEAAREAQRQAAAQALAFEQDWAMQAAGTEAERLLQGERYGYEAEAAEEEYQRLLQAGEVQYGQERNLQMDRLMADFAGQELDFDQRIALGQQDFSQSLEMMEQQAMQQGLANGSLYYTEDQKRQRRILDDAEGKIQSDPRFSPEQRVEAMTEIRRRRQAIRPVERPMDERPLGLQEDFDASVLIKDGRNYVKSIDGEWQRMRGDTDPEFPQENMMKWQQEQVMAARKQYDLEAASWDAWRKAKNDHIKTMRDTTDTEGNPVYSVKQIKDEADLLFGRDQPRPTPPPPFASPIAGQMGPMPPEAASGVPPGFGDSSVRGFGPEPTPVPPMPPGAAPPVPSASRIGVPFQSDANQPPPQPVGDTSYLKRMRDWREMNQAQKVDTYIKDLPPLTEEQLANPVPKPPKGKEPAHGAVVFMFDRAGQPILAQWNAHKKVYVAIGPYEGDVSKYAPENEVPRQRLDEPSRMHLFGPGL